LFSEFTLVALERLSAWAELLNRSGHLFFTQFRMENSYILFLELL